MLFVGHWCRAAGALPSVRASIVSFAIAVLVGGCAAANSGPSKVAGPISTYPGDPAPRPALSRAAPVEMEADGLPAQVAPKTRRSMRDDPSEPWSPNYGTVRPGERVSVPAKSPIATASPVLPSAVQAAAPRLAPDDIIRIAIAEHEMRRH